MMDIQPGTGTYALVLPSLVNTSIQVGKLGEFRLHPGYFVYVGSAFGPGGLRARIAHHRRTTTRPHWHIDYLRRVLPLQDVWYSFDPQRREHHWAKTMGERPEGSIPFPGFGASDCACLTHLFFFKTKPSLAAFRRGLRAHTSQQARIFRLELFL